MTLLVSVLNVQVELFSYFFFRLVFSIDVEVTAIVNSSTNIYLNWTFGASTEELKKTLSGIIIFYKVLKEKEPFHHVSLPPTTTSHLLKNLQKFTSYEILVAPSSRNGTGIPSKTVIRETFEDGKLHISMKPNSDQSLKLSLHMEPNSVACDGFLYALYLNLQCIIGNLKLETPAFFCVTRMRITLTES